MTTQRTTATNKAASTTATESDRPNEASAKAISFNIEEIAKDATPRQIREWIDRLETLYDEKRTRVRNDLQDRVTDLMASNGYTIEELFGARVLPSAADLADLANQTEKASGKNKERLMDSVCHT